MKHSGRQWERKHRLFSRGVALIGFALRRLRKQELAWDYAAAFSEVDEKTAEFWETTASDGLNASVD